jgi:hypothetical protein
MPDLALADFLFADLLPRSFCDTWQLSRAAPRQRWRQA